jgi:2-dehydropantoate 2-reductase
MKITVFGAGATGGNFAVRLARAGHDVSVVARGEHLAAIREHGLTLKAGDETVTVPLRAAADGAEFGAQDVVYTGVKATGLGQIVEALRPLVGEKTLVVFPQNGIPWWYPVGLAGKPRPPDLPFFRLAEGFLSYLLAERIVGGSIYSANEVEAPGVVRNTSPGTNRLDLGAITQAEPPELAGLREAFREAGITCADCPDIRRVTWRKLLVNMSGSIISLITRNKASVVRSDAALAELYRRVVAEGLAIARAHGYDLAGEVDADAMIARLPDHKPSILQDYEAGRPMEIAQIVLAPRAFARAAGLETPVLDTMAALAARIAADAGLFDQDA